MTQKHIRSILDFRKPISVLSIEYHIYTDEIHGIAKIRGAQEPFVMYMRTKHFDWAMQKFNAALTKHRWTSSNKETTLKAYYYNDIYNEVHKQEPYKMEEL